MSDLTGTYSCNDGGTYQMAQDGTNLYSHGIAGSVGGWSNVFFGSINGSTVGINWADIPGGIGPASGAFALTIGKNGQGQTTLTTTGLHPNFAGTIWTMESAGYGG